MLTRPETVPVCLCLDNEDTIALLSRALSSAGFPVHCIAQDEDAMAQAQVVIFQPSARTAHYLNEFGTRKAWIAFSESQIGSDVEAYRAQGMREVLYQDELAPLRLRRTIGRALYAQRSLQQLSRFDSLTGLYSNRGFLEVTDQALFNVASNGRLVALLALDIRQFNDLNAQFGFSFADLVLTHVAERLRRALGPLAKIARLGGDEFLILLENLANREAAERLVRRILSLFEEPIEVEQHHLGLSVDIGVVCYPQTLGSAEDLMRKAHTAMHQAKKQQCTVFRHEQGQANTARGNLEQELRQGLRRNEFELYYQPRVCIHTHRLLGMEALIRWHHPERGTLSPGEFIQVAEHSGLIVPLGYWIIDQVCSDLQVIQSHGLDDVTVASNLSFRQLQDEQFCHVMPRLLKRSGTDATLLEFELTETTVLTDPRRALEALQAVHELGATLSLDDFGTGYSSLTHIRQFPISLLKIDRSFTQRVTLDREADSIVRSIINLAHDLNLKVVAEGVENPAQLEFLVSNGCDQVQGFLFSHPRPLWETLQLIDHTLRHFNDQQA
ncbi:MAG: bifunctional diguanylate cyclase/phosphodiesterase [Natronospirillum sp.]|uniref:putative bifunctional diguanylate cyclase/phosphodiesterase n=1 Tax=Natronospirillum sp. TaxID=2812955 RepID=UPI0025EFE2BA|nr:bifunctional diguanylate cyclase/phosphodiesterase [Natronospirillum sp.]MCH8551985.1 bifunctional diguanylate cyclase/phosphodiesterase [Natronospirillum sp.]